MVLTALAWPRSAAGGETVSGPWLRTVSLLAVGTTGLVVASGALRPGLEHRALALTALAPLVALFLGARIAHPRLLIASAAALGLTVLEAATGGIVILAPGAPWTEGLHITIGAAAFAATTLAATMAFRGHAAPEGTWSDYVALTKPRIMVLLLITAAGGMFAAARGLPSPIVLLALLAGGALASGGASAINHVMDRDIDRLMARTGRRPVAAERLSPSRALEFGLALSAFSFVVLVSLVNVLAAFLALAGNLFYVLVYTAWLKRSTPQNIVIGGAAGAIPPITGWAAATGRLSLGALFLFLIVFFWTPPHFWALALVIKRQYAAAGVPMLPVVRGERATTAGISGYATLLVGASVLPFVWGGMGVVYLVPAVMLGAGFLLLVWRLRQDTTPVRARALFRYSLVYLAGVFVALAVAPLIS
jgi:protoheme IX farnesyltransferase